MDRNKITKMRRKKNGEESIMFEHYFDSHITKDMLSYSLCELLKHLMYTRYQIPMPFAILLNETLKERKKTAESVSDSSYGNHRRRSKKSFFVGSMCTICDAIVDVSRVCTIKKLVLMFGSTIVSPKETIVIDVCADAVETYKETNVKNACRKLLRNICTDDRFTGLPKLSSSKVYILLCLAEAFPQHYKSDLFLPRNDFKLSSRGDCHFCHLYAKETTSEMSDVASYEQTPSDLIGKLENLDIGSNEFWCLCAEPLHGYKEKSSNQ